VTNRLYIGIVLGVFAACVLASATCGVAGGRHKTRPEQSPPVGTVLAYTFDDGDRLHDWSGCGYHGAASNSPAWSVGGVGVSPHYTFQRADSDWIDAGDVDPATECTISVWFKPTNNWVAASWYMGLFSRGYPWSEEHYLYRLYNSQAQIYLEFSAVSHRAALRDVGDWQYGRWNHLVTVFSVLRDVFAAYDDGALVASTPLTADTRAAVDASTTIGEQDNGAHRFNGLIDDITVIHRALSTAEVVDLYNQGRATHR